MTSPVRIYFLGGVGEIGRNCAAIECDGKLLIVDCGLMFPDARMPGVDLVLPDFTFLRERADDVLGVVITHGHEDHMGALAYMLRDVNVPVYGSSVTLALASSRLEEAGLDATLRRVDDGGTIDIGPFNVEFIPVTHSVPHGFALAITTSQGLIFHTGDFKLDPKPIDGRMTDIKRVKELAKKPGIRLLMSDSTNAEEMGRAGSESEVGRVLAEIFAEHPKHRIIIACFASHIHRIQQIITAAEANGRKVATLGRSMARNLTMAREEKLLEVQPKTLINIEDIDDYKREEICVLSTGSQGEPLSALALIANDENKWLSADENDLVIMSSHVIPGNETAVYSVIDGICRRGVEVIYGDIAPVHTSGHAKRDELVDMLKAAQPKCFIPVHGEYRHLIQHRKLAISTGVNTSNALIAEDGDVVELSDNGIKIVDTVPADYIYVDGFTDDLSQSVLRDRNLLSSEGVVVVVATIDIRAGKLEVRPEVITRGWIYGEEADDLLEDARQCVRDKLEKVLHPHPDIDVIKQDIRRALGKFVNQRTGRRPMIVPIVMEI